MATLTLKDVEAISGRGRPWTLRLEYVGPNLSNISGTSAKYWYATGRAQSEPVEVGFGAIGSTALTSLTTWPEFCQRVHDKLAKGYKYVSTPYVRMTQESIDKILGVQTPTPRLPPFAPVAPQTATQATTAIPTPTPVVKPTYTVSPLLVGLGEPYSLVTHLKIIRDGVKVRAYEARDSGSNELFKLNPDAGLKFAQDYGVEIQF